MTTRTEELLIKLLVDGQQAKDSLKNVENQTKKTQQAFNAVGNNTKRFNAQLQNSSYQIADFAVQVGSGTSALQAFSQQAPQLLAGFGAIGAAVGAATAILAAGANSLFKFGSAAESAAEETEKIAESIKGLISPATGLANLNKLLKESGSRFSDLGGALKTATLTKAKNDLAGLEEEAANLVDTLSVLGEGNTVSRYLVLQSKGLSDAEAAYQSLNEYISDIYGVSEEAANSIRELAKQFSDGSIAVEDFAEGVLALGVDPDTEGYAELLSLLQKIAEQAQRVKDLSKIDIELSVRGESLQEAIDAWDEYMAGLDRLASGYLDTLDPLRAYYREVNKLKELLDANLISLEQYRQLIENIRGELLKPIEVKVKPVDVKPAKTELEGIKALLEDIQNEAGKWSDQFANTLVSGLAEGKLAFKDFANYVLEQLARIAISKALEPLFQGFGNFIGSLGGASAPVAAGLIATPVNDLPLSREASSAQQMIVGVPRLSAPSPSSSPVTVNVMNYGSDDVEVNERKTSRGIEVDVLIKNTVKSGISSGDFDKVMATSFGTRRLAY